MLSNKRLDSIVQVEGKYANPVSLLNRGMDKYGEIRTFFSTYRNPIGIELEIENVNSDFHDRMCDSIYWRYHEEGSLKNKGAEYVSLTLSGQNIDYAIHEYSKISEPWANNLSFSIRTSTHVHVNVSALTETELLYLAVLSAYFEPLLYSFCEPIRRHNPFCYPIADLAPPVIWPAHDEMKYCGINLAPVRKQLSMEYRQLHGTRDAKTLRRWVQLLCKLYYFVKHKGAKTTRQLLYSSLATEDHVSAAKQVLGASIVLFNDFSIMKENLPWVLATLSYFEGE